MVQWLCLISPTLFDAWVSYFQIMRQWGPNFDLKSKYKSTWPIFHGLVIIPRHLCQVVYSFCLSIRWFVCSCLYVHTSVPFVELLQSFTLKHLQWSIFYQPLIRKHSYLDHRYPGGSAFIPWLLTPGSMPRGGARGQKLGHLSVMEPTYADSWSNMAQPCDMGLWVMKWRSAWPIFHGPVILSYLLKTIWCTICTSYFGSLNQYDPTFTSKLM